MPFSEKSSVLNALSSSARDIADARFLVGIMGTQDHLGKAMRLLESCRAHALAAVLYEVPAVHWSINTSGNDDLSCTRPSFIRFLLDKYQKPVLLLDAACVVVESPARIFSLVDEGIDFAIYNWLADEHNEAYESVSVQVQDGWSTVVSSGRYYRLTRRVPLYDPSQLMCGGDVQFWNNSDNARELLIGWQRLIERDPKCADTHCLDFVFNYRGAALPALKTAWLDKSYQRMGWWIQVKPVIDHPDNPGPTIHESIEKREGVPRVIDRTLVRVSGEPVFPADCLIDTVENTLVRPNLQNSFTTVGPLPVPIWVTRD